MWFGGPRSFRSLNASFPQIVQQSSADRGIQSLGMFKALHMSPSGRPAHSNAISTSLGRFSLIAVTVRRFSVHIATSVYSQLNDDKTEVLVITTPSSVSKHSLTDVVIGDIILQPTAVARNIGVMFDSELSMKSKVSKLCQIFAFIVAMIGISIITYMRLGSGSSDMWGAIMAIVATGGAACYKVLFKRFFGAANACQISMFLSCLGLFNLVGMIPVLSLLYFTNVEPMTWDTIPWALLCGVAGFTFAINVLQMYTEEWTYPWLLQISFILAIPLSAGAELVYNPHFEVDALQVTAYVLIVLSFPLNMLPRDWQDRLIKTMRWQCLRNAVGNGADDGSVSNVSAAHITPRQRLRTSQA
ncbi:putative thiamine transporter SLC35F3 [Lamellibrachia satsuma]|nr:putative thiamine transporter SLC35F3 [Lamellibrachia satsuma]